VSVLSPPGLVSILVPCCGMLEYTKLCVPGVLKHSRPPFELIAIDIGSLDGTAEYLAGSKKGTCLSGPAPQGSRRGQTATVAARWPPSRPNLTALVRDETPSNSFS
jgi:hypothetical protein